jgi:hypothetical protein
VSRRQQKNLPFGRTLAPEPEGEKTMNIRAQLRTFATTSLLALAVLSLTATATHAAANTGSKKQDCINRGYSWVDGKGCADKHCTFPGILIPVHPGTNFQYNGKEYYCDGLTGNFVPLRTAPSGPSSMTGAPTTAAQP